MESKYLKYDKNNPSPVAQCDRSGFMFNKTDMDFQYEWRGDSYVNTGLLVAKIFLDSPNEQSRPPLIKADPRPVENARPYVALKSEPNCAVIASLERAHWGQP